MDLYRGIILDHYKHPHNFGELEGADAAAEGYNATCGDRFRMELRFGPDGNVTEVGFSGEGCAISVASASLLTDRIKGMSREEILHLTAADVLSLLHTQLTPSRVKCATLPLEVLDKALNGSSGS